MFNDISSNEPTPSQYIVFKSGDMVFAGFYVGDKKACPFSVSGIKSPIIVITEWMAIRLWE